MAAETIDAGVASETIDAGVAAEKADHEAWTDEEDAEEDPYASAPWRRNGKPENVEVIGKKRIPIVFLTFGRNGPDRKQRESEMGNITCCEFGGRYTGDRDNKRSRLTSLLDDKAINACSGHNGRILLLTAMHPETPRIFRIVKEAVMRATHPEMEAYKGCKYVHGLRCRSGRHRGPAEGELLAHAARSHGFIVDLYHLDCDEHTSRKPCGCPLACEVLTRSRWISEDAKSAVARSWAADGDVALSIAERIWEIV